MKVNLYQQNMASYVSKCYQSILTFQHDNFMSLSTFFLKNTQKQILREQSVLVNKFGYRCFIKTGLKQISWYLIFKGINLILYSNLI